MCPQEIPNSYQELYQTLTDYYCDISLFNEKNKEGVRNLARDIILQKKKLMQFKKEVEDEAKELNN